MMNLLTGFIQDGGGPGTVPDLGVRVSVWFIGMFLLAVGGAVIYLRMKELQEERKNRDSENI